MSVRFTDRFLERTDENHPLPASKPLGYGRIGLGRKPGQERGRKPG